MSLKADLEARGVKLTVLAKELEEVYGNLYTALQMEDQGREIKHKAVLARITKIREWLATSTADEERVATSVEGAMNRATFLSRVSKSPVPASWVVHLSALAASKTIECGDVLTIREGDETNRYRFLRIIEAPAGTWADLFGPLPTAKTSMAPKTCSRHLDVLGLAVPS